MRSPENDWNSSVATCPYCDDAPCSCEERGLNEDPDMGRKPGDAANIRQGGPTMDEANKQPDTLSIPMGGLLSRLAKMRDAAQETADESESRIGRGVEYEEWEAVQEASHWRARQAALQDAIDAVWETAAGKGD